MRYRQLGDSGIRISEIGFGTWGVGGATPGATSYGRTDDSVSRNALSAAADLGINFFDTANVYGDGHSEELIGKVFAGRREKIVIATKAGFSKFGALSDYSPPAIRASLEGSLKRLNTDYVDVIQLHNADPVMLTEHPEIVTELHRLRDSGLIRAFGFSLKSPEDGALAMALGCNIIQINFSMLDMRALHCGLISAAEHCGVSVVARTPLCFGFLSGKLNAKTKFSKDDHRSRWSMSQLAKWIDGAEALFDVMPDQNSSTRSQLALRFCLSFKSVSTVIPGMLTAEEVFENSFSSDLGPLSEKEIIELEKVYSLLDLSLAQ